MGRVLHAKGIGKPEPTPFTQEEIKKYFEGVRLDCHSAKLILDLIIGISVILLRFKLSMQGRAHSSAWLEEHSFNRGLP